MAHDWKVYDAFVERRAAHTGSMMREANQAVRQKTVDERAIRIARALQQLCNADPDAFLGLDPIAWGERIASTL